MEELLPAKAIFMDGKVPGPLTGEERRWLVKQLAAYPKRVNEARTCCIGALTDMAATEFCRLMADGTQLDELRAENARDRRTVAAVLRAVDNRSVPTMDSVWSAGWNSAMDFVSKAIIEARKALGGTNGQ